MHERAEASSGAAIAETRGPFTVTAASLAATSDGFEWTVTLLSPSEVQAQQPHVGSGFIALPQANGRIIISITPHHGWHFYVEVDAEISPADRPLRLDSLMNPSGPANGVATRDPQTGLWYFTTPMGHDSDRGIVTIDSMVEPFNAGSSMSVRSVSLLAFR